MRLREIACTLALALQLHAQSANPPSALPQGPERKQTVPVPLPDSPFTQRELVLPPNRDAGIVPAPHVQFDADHPYTLPELVDIAEREHPETRVAWETARNAALGAGIAASTYLPRVTANIIGGYQGSTGEDSSLGFTLHNSGNVAGSVSALSLEWLLFDFGGRRNIVDAAHKLSNSSNIAFTGAHQRVIYAVSVAYYAYLAGVQRQHTAESALANAKEVEVAANARYRQGEGTVLETAQTRQLTAQSQFALVQAQGAEADAYVTLLAAMGVSPLERMQIAPLEHHALSSEDLGPVNQIVQEALDRRPDVQAAYAALQASEASVKAAEAQNRPKIFLAGTGAYVSGQLGLTAIPAIGEQLPTLNVSGNHWNSTLLLGLTIPVFDGNQRANSIQQAKNNVDKAKATLDGVRLNAIREIVSAQNALRTSLAANDAVQVLQAAAQTTYDAALDSYKQGVGTVTASVTAQTQLLQAQLAADDAYNSALSAAVTLAFATGSLGAAPR
ncbi:MAG TPA: TolC family protein [Granulicella sp.]